MAQTYKPADKVVIEGGPDGGRYATVVENFEGIYGDDLSDGALVKFDDGRPSRDPAAGQGLKREFASAMLRHA